MALKYLSQLHKASRQIAIWIEERLPDLPANEGHLVSYLLPYGPCPVSELVRVFGVKHSTMTSILDRLEERGLIERKVNPSDKRSLLVGLTRQGAATAKKIGALLAELEGAINSEVSPTDYARFLKVLGAIERVTSVKVR
ncbi:MAG TPA: MarR family transcriptional regulator [Thermoanaerobaculia bacterium]|jgi:DNA-binding MarR family transcriptional regulator